MNLEYTFKWRIRARTDGIDFNRDYPYCDDKCLESTCFYNDMCDFAENNGFIITEEGHDHINSWILLVKINNTNEIITERIRRLKEFSTGRFRTTNISLKKSNGEWLILYKKNLKNEIFRNFQKIPTLDELNFL